MEAEFLLVVLPEIEDAGPQRLETLASPGRGAGRTALRSPGRAPPSALAQLIIIAPSVLAVLASSADHPIARDRRQRLDAAGSPPRRTSEPHLLQPLQGVGEEPAAPPAPRGSACSTGGRSGPGAAPCRRRQLLLGHEDGRGRAPPGPAPARCSASSRAAWESVPVRREGQVAQPARGIDRREPLPPHLDGEPGLGVDLAEQVVALRSEVGALRLLQLVRDRGPAPRPAGASGGGAPAGSPPPRCPDRRRRRRAPRSSGAASGAPAPTGAATRRRLCRS